MRADNRFKLEVSDKVSTNLHPAEGIYTTVEPSSFTTIGDEFGHYLDLWASDPVALFRVGAELVRAAANLGVERGDTLGEVLVDAVTQLEAVEASLEAEV